MEHMSRRGPENANTFKHSQMPQIGGSVAGFIALIIVLCLIIIVSLSGIILLIRENSSSDVEMQKNQRPSSATYVAAFDDEAKPQPNSWFSRTYQRLLFIRTGSADRLSLTRIPQLSSQSESLAHSAEHQKDSKNEDSLKPPQSYHYTRPLHKDRLGVRTSVSMSSGLRRLSSSPTTSSLRFEVGGARETLPSERDKFVPSPATTLPTIYTQLSSRAPSPASVPTSSPRRSRIISQEIPNLIIPASTQQDVTRHSTLSSPSFSPLTFEGGSKFLEAL